MVLNYRVVFLNCNRNSVNYSSIILNVESRTVKPKWWNFPTTGSNYLWEKVDNCGLCMKNLFAFARPPFHSIFYRQKESKLTFLPYWS